MKYHIDACPDCGKYLYPDTIHTCTPKDAAREAFDRLYGHLLLSGQDAAWHVFKSGWEAREQSAPAPAGYAKKIESLIVERDALKAKLAEQTAPAQEPDPDELTIAYMSGVYKGKKRKPLTDQQITEIAAQGHRRWIEFARAIEAAHGITKGTP